MPLGPFTAKNWATQVSPWVVTPEALAPFAAAPAAAQEPPPPAYLRQAQRRAYDVRLSVEVLPALSLIHI